MHGQRNRRARRSIDIAAIDLDAPLQPGERRVVVLDIDPGDTGQEHRDDVVDLGAGARRRHAVPEAVAHRGELELEALTDRHHFDVLPAVVGLDLQQGLRPTGRVGDAEDLGPDAQWLPCHDPRIPWRHLEADAVGKRIEPRGADGPTRRIGRHAQDDGEGDARRRSKADRACDLRAGNDAIEIDPADAARGVGNNQPVDAGVRCRIAEVGGAGQPILQLRHLFLDEPGHLPGRGRAAQRPEHPGGVSERRAHRDHRQHHERQVRRQPDAIDDDRRQHDRTAARRGACRRAQHRGHRPASPDASQKTAEFVM